MENKKIAQKRIFILLIYSLIIFIVSPCVIAQTNTLHIQKEPIQYTQIKDILYLDNYGNYYLQYFRYWRSDNLKHYHYEKLARDLRKDKDKIVELKDIINEKKFHQINNSQYYGDGSNIYTIVYSFATDICVLILNLNPQKIETIGNYIKDDNKVYFGDREVLEANAQEFNVLFIQEVDNVTKESLTIELGYDNSHLYSGENVLKYSNFNELEIDKKLKASLIKKYFYDKN